MQVDINHEILQLVDHWCERRNLRHLATILPYWPPPNGFTDEWHHVLKQLRHLRAMGRDDLQVHGEYDAVSKVIAEITMRLYPAETATRSEEQLSELLDELFGSELT